LQSFAGRICSKNIDRQNDLVGQSHRLSTEQINGIAVANLKALKGAVSKGSKIPGAIAQLLKSASPEELQWIS